MATSTGVSLLSSVLWVLLLLLSQVCLPAFADNRQSRQQSEWRIERLEATEPSRKVQAEAGVIEYWDHHHEQFQGAGVAPYRTTIQPRGLLLPFYSNSPRLSYLIQGKGFYGSVVPGCPETFQQSHEQRSERGGKSDGNSRSSARSIRRFTGSGKVTSSLSPPAWPAGSIMTEITSSITVEL